jgi:hypothetical protein
MKNEKKKNSNIKEEKNSSNTIIFKFSDGTISEYDINSISSLNPILFSNIDKNINYEISLPDYITKNSLMEFLFILKNNLNEIEELEGNYPNNFLTFIKISDFFKNNQLSIKIINEILLNKINDDSVFDFLIFSYERLNKSNKEEVDNCYFELFYKCLEMIGNNEILFLKNLNRIKSLDKRVVDELLQKIFSHLIYGNYIYFENESEEIISEPENYFDTINENEHQKKKFISMNNLNNLITSLYDIYKTQNFFELLTFEYMSLFSHESINELNNVPNPTFQMKINVDDIENYYEEFPINFNINNKNIIFVVFYKISDDSFNICMKFGDNKNNKRNYNNNENYENFCFKIFTFLSIVKVSYGNFSKPFSSQTNLKSLSNNKSMHNIFKLTNFTSAINKTKLMKENLNLSNNSNSNYFFFSINLKLCYIHSFLTSYFLRNYSKLCKLKEINKVSKQLLILVLKNKYLDKTNENDIVIGINNWLNDEINLKEDITELIDGIKWENVDDEYIFEFIIKYSNMIVGNELIENFLINGFQKKYNNAFFILKMIKCLFKATSIINYGNLYTLMKKNEKYNLAYLSRNSMTNNNVNYSLNSNINLNINNTQNCSKKYTNTPIKQNNINENNINENNINENNINENNNKENNNNENKVNFKSNNYDNNANKTIYFNKKSKSYSFSKTINKKNFTNTKQANIKKTIKSPQTQTSIDKNNIINIIIKPKINYTTLNKTHIFSPINERQRSPIEYHKVSPKAHKKKNLNKIDDMKKIFSNNEIQFTNDNILEKELFKEGKKKKNKRNNSFSLRFNNSMNYPKRNIIKNIINQNENNKKSYQLNNIKKIK